MQSHSAATAQTILLFCLDRSHVANLKLPTMYVQNIVQVNELCINTK